MLRDVLAFSRQLVRVLKCARGFDSLRQVWLVKRDTVM